MREEKRKTLWEDYEERLSLIYDDDGRTGGFSHGFSSCMFMFVSCGWVAVL